MYFPYFITYMAIGMVISLPVFFWALHNGQFKDQQRARFLPLENDPPDAARTSPWGRYEIYGLFTLAVLGLGASAAVLMVALFHG